MCLFQHELEIQHLELSIETVHGILKRKNYEKTQHKQYMYIKMLIYKYANYIFNQ